MPPNPFEGIAKAYQTFESKLLEKPARTVEDSSKRGISRRKFLVFGGSLAALFSGIGGKLFLDSQQSAQKVKPPETKEHAPLTLNELEALIWEVGMNRESSPYQYDADAKKCSNDALDFIQKILKEHRLPPEAASVVVSLSFDSLLSPYSFTFASTGPR
jgi:hypothetical protein